MDLETVDRQRHPYQSHRISSSVQGCHLDSFFVMQDCEGGGLLMLISSSGLRCLVDALSWIFRKRLQITKKSLRLKESPVPVPVSSDLIPRYGEGHSDSSVTTGGNWPFFSEFEVSRLVRNIWNRSRRWKTLTGSPVYGISSHITMENVKAPQRLSIGTLRIRGIWPYFSWFGTKSLGADAERNCSWCHLACIQAAISDSSIQAVEVEQR